MLTKVHCNICQVSIINHVHEEIESIKDFFLFMKTCIYYNYKMNKWNNIDYLANYTEKHRTAHYQVEI